MRNFDCFCLCISLFIMSLSFSSLCFAHRKTPPFDPHNCSCINVCSSPPSQEYQYTHSSSSSSSNKENHKSSEEGSQNSSSHSSSSSSSKENHKSSEEGSQNSPSHSSSSSSSKENNKSSEEGSQNSSSHSSSSSSSKESHKSSEEGSQNSSNAGNQNSSNQKSSSTGQSSSSKQNYQNSNQGNKNSSNEYSQSFSSSNNNNNSNAQNQATQSSSSKQSDQSSSKENNNNNSFNNNNNNNNDAAQNQGKQSSSSKQSDQSSSSKENNNNNSSNNNNNAQNQATQSSWSKRSDQSSSSGESDQTYSGQETQKGGQQSSNQDSNQNSQNSYSSSGGFSFSGHFSKIYAFGDSFTDTGNGGLSQGLDSFYGSKSNLPGQRLSNGRLMIDFLCDTLGLPSLQAYKQSSANFSSGINFAIAGSTCLSNGFFSRNKIPNPLMWTKKPENVLTQVDWFHNFLQNSDCKGLGDDDCRSQIGNSLFWVGALGFSDYIRIFGAASSGHSIAEVSVDYVSKFLKAFLDKGAKYIVVQGLPPAGCCPLQLFFNAFKGRDNMGCSSIINSLIIAHNNLLREKIAEFQAQYSGSVIVYADTWGAFKEVMTKHKDFNFQEPYKACCGAGGGMFNFNLNSLCGAAGTSACRNPQNFISWDGVHFTESMHKTLADLMFHKGFCYPSFDTLIKAKMGHKVKHGAKHKMAAQAKMDWKEAKLGLRAAKLNPFGIH